MDNDTLLELTADIVSAHLGHNRVDVADVPRLIQSVYDGLAEAALPAQAIETRPEPAVSIRSSLTTEAIVCLECGARMKMLKRHLTADHGLSPADYRTRWGLPASYPMVAPAHSETRRAIARTTGLGRKPDGRQASDKPQATATQPTEMEPEASGSGAE